jgi:hypothetical protein
MFTRSHYWSLSWARRIQSIPLHPIYLRCFLILSPTYVWVFLMVSLTWFFHQDPICIPLHLMRATWASRITLLDPIILVYFMKSTSYEVRHAVFSNVYYYFGPLRFRYLLSTLFSGTLGFCSSLNVRDQDSYPYKVIFLYVLSNSICISIYFKSQNKMNTQAVSKCCRLRLFERRMSVTNLQLIQSLIDKVV